MTVRPRPASPDQPTSVETDHPHEGLKPALFTCQSPDLRDRQSRAHPSSMPSNARAPQPDSPGTGSGAMLPEVDAAPPRLQTGRTGVRTG